MTSVSEIGSRSEWKRFIELPYRLYKSDLNWIAPLRISQKALFDLKKNPFWKTCDHVFFLALKGGQPVGRIAAIIHHDYNKTNAATGFFGFVEAIEEQEVFKQLFEKAELWLKARGCKKIIGPVNPSINYEMGILIKGFELQPSLMMTYNFKYYPHMIEAAGYGKEMDFFAYYTGKDAPTRSEKTDRIIELTKKKYAISVRRVRIRDFTTEIRILHSLYNDAFSNHYGFVAMTEEEFRFMGKDLRQIVDEDLLLIAEYNNEPIGFILGLPNYNEVFSHIKNGKLFPTGWIKFLYYKRKIRSVRVLTIAVGRKYQHLGVGAYLYKEIIKRAHGKNIREGEMSWVAGNNVRMNKAAVEMGGVINKTYRLYNKNIM